VLSVKLSFHGRRANIAWATKTARPQRPTFSLGACVGQFCNRLWSGGIVKIIKDRRVLVG
jgi:hypothetical protein